MARRKRALDGLDNDIRDHIERETQNNIEKGMAPGEARRQAMLALGKVAVITEDTRAVWIRPSLDAIRQDVRYPQWAVTSDHQRCRLELWVSGNTATCTRSDPLAPGANYPSITLTVNVVSTAPPSVTNMATVGGGGDGNTVNNSASDTATVLPASDLAITKSHTGNFTQGQPGTYTLTVSNHGGGATTGSVTVVDDLPAGLVPNSASGTGWTCSISGQEVSCASSDPLAPGQSQLSIDHLTRPSMVPGTVRSTTRPRGRFPDRHFPPGYPQCRSKGAKCGLQAGS